MENQVWCIPLGADLALVYAPFHGLTTLVNRASAELLCARQRDRSVPLDEASEWIRKLEVPGSEPVRKKYAPDPLYLGLIPTSGCMLRCAYCDFPSGQASRVMPFDMIRQAVDGYADLLRDNGAADWQMHFFGGEPFAAYKEAVFALNYARQRADELGLPTHFEVTTNGYYSEEKAVWIAEHFDTVVLSMDGFPKAQDRHRPAPGGSGSFSTVSSSADIFAAGNCELIIRSCISAENVTEMAEWAAFIADRFFPETVVLEPMIESPLARRNGLHAPDPDTFIRHWTEAYRVLRREGIPLVYSSGEITALKTSLCPMGQDAVIVSPEGRIGGCWRIAETPVCEGIDLRFGGLTGDGLRIDMNALERQRELQTENRERCRNCFCFAHCAGGCVLNRDRNAEFCRMTRALTLWQLLERLGYGKLGDRLLCFRDFTDRLADETDFSCSGVAMNDWPEFEWKDDPGASAEEPRAVPRTGDLPAAPADPDRGWLRDGRTYRVIDVQSGSVQSMTGLDALRFQLDHAGLSSADRETVLNALCGGNS